MKLLITTQAVDQDDPVLGFFHRWIVEFAKHCESISVICLKEGRHSLPANVSVYSLGKERGESRLRYVLNFYRYVWTLRHEYDAVFVHMNPEYVVLGGPLWRVWGKRIGLWYVHRSVTAYLRFSVLLVNVVFTAARTSMRLPTDKKRVVGHGVDTELFTPTPLPSSGLHLLSVGRLAPVKRCEVLLKALSILCERGIAADVAFAGPADDREYADALKTKVATLGLQDSVRFLGPVPYYELPVVYQAASATVNLATGGLDKVVLESLASGRPAFVCNSSFADLYGEYADMLMFRGGDPVDLADRIEKFSSLDTAATAHELSERVRSRFGLASLIRAIMKEL